MSEDKIEATGIVESGQDIAFVEDILNHVRNGRVTFEYAGRSITLTPDEATKMEIKVKHKDGKQKLSFELAWKEDLHLGGMPDLKVSSEKEKPAETEVAH